MMRIVQKLGQLIVLSTHSLSFLGFGFAHIFLKDIVKKRALGTLWQFSQTNHLTAFIN